MSKVGSILAKMAIREPTSEAELNQMRRRAWHEQEVIVIKPSEINDAWLRQGVVNLAEKQFGRRVQNGKR